MIANTITRPRDRVPGILESGRFFDLGCIVAGTQETECFEGRRDLDMSITWKRCLAV